MEILIEADCLLRSVFSDLLLEITMSIKQADRDEVGGAAHEVAERVTKEQANDRHRHLEARHHETDTKALLRRQATHAERGRDGESVEPERQDEEDQREHRRTRVIGREDPSVLKASRRSAAANRGRKT